MDFLVLYASRNRKYDYSWDTGAGNGPLKFRTRWSSKTELTFADMADANNSGNSTFVVTEMFSFTKDYRYLYWLQIQRNSVMFLMLSF